MEDQKRNYKETKEQFMERMNQLTKNLAQKTRRTELEIARELDYILEHKLESQKQQL